LRIRGYTLLECMLVLMILMVTMLLTVPVTRNIRDVFYVQWKIDEIVMKQYESICQSEKLIYDDPENDINIYFSRLGMVRHADTFHVRNKKIIISLGTGRLYEKE